MYPSQIALVGLGTIGRALYTFLRERGVRVRVFDQSAQALSGLPAEEVLTEEDLLQGSFDWIVEAASREAVASLGEKLLRKAPLVVLSLSALAEEGLLQQLLSTSEEAGHKLFIPEGALLGAGALLSVRHGLKEARLTTIKPPGSLGQAREEGLLFQGSAREACAKFPRNLNVAATLSLYGVGFEKTKVSLFCQRGQVCNRHEVVARGEFGEMAFAVESLPSASNPRTSSVTLISLKHSLNELLLRRELPDLATLCRSLKVNALSPQKG